MDDDDADSGAGEHGIVLAGCDGALFSVARAVPTTRQGSRTIDEASLFDGSCDTAAAELRLCGNALSIRTAA